MNRKKNTHADHARSARRPLQLAVPALTAVMLLSGCQSTQQTTPEGSAMLADSKAEVPHIKDDLKARIIAEVEDLDKADSELAADTVSPDLWVRLRGGFAMDHSNDQPRVAAELERYSRYTTYLGRTADRSSRYLHFIIEETEARNMPMEMALLPIVESGFDPFAYSHGRAAGMWQFIASTGKLYGLEQDWWYDGRRDVIASTRAALDHLQDLHEMFGDWMLALAAYNSGPGTVMKAIRRNKSAGKPTDFWHLQLPKETSAYVPKLMAVSTMFQNPEQWNLKLPEVINEPYFEVVEVGQQIDMARAAAMAGIEPNELYKLNPGFNRWATSPNGPHHLLLPVEVVDEFEANLENMDSKDWMKWQRYTIKPGDSLIKIAKLFRTRPELIRQVNELDGNRIVAGKPLLIPVPSANSDNYKLTADQRTLAKQNKPRKGRRQVQYTVKEGDSFWIIARRYDVKVRQLARWNNMAPGDPLRVGKTLSIWTSKGMPKSGVVRRVSYKVRQGDNLSVIASRFSVGVSQIKDWNAKTRSQKYLQPGQLLTLYVDVTRAR
ncbi:LysM peptidoglycan-binding domain-containing protein [Endozoicomonadaceae bacterium StTr2]